jgi:2-amino-4-hydroxy-6-hydroxymethyldihydropteridine diphosphokinase
LGDREATLNAAIAEISALPGTSLDWVSEFVESVALTLTGSDESAPRYINCVLQVATELEPLELLHRAQAIELAHGRIRDQRWASRTLDIDIVQFGDLEQHDLELTLPHPEAVNRNFVLWPWGQADTNAELQGHGRVRDLPNFTSAGLRRGGV